MTVYKQPGRKEYDGNRNKNSFQIIEKCQEFATRVYQYTVKAEKEYRLTICKTVQDYCCELIHSARKANSIQLHDPFRQEAHKESLEYMERINDLLPVLRRLRCMSPNQEAELHKKFNNLRYGYMKWIEGDERRIKNEIKG